MAIPATVPLATPAPVLAPPTPEAARTASARFNATRRPCEQLLNRKRLGQVIVGAGIEPCHLVHHGIARGDHNHRHILVLADTPQDLHAVELRQQHIEQNQIVVALQRQVHGGAAIGGVLHLVALVLQFERHKAGDFLLVLYNQDPCHTCPRLRLLVVVQILLDVVRGVGGVIH